MSKRVHGLGLVDLLATVALFVLISAVAAPVLERSRELSRRLVCGNNLKALGGAAEVYADANNGRWMTPPFAENRINKEGIHYTCNGTSGDDPACVGYAPEQDGISDPPNPLAGRTALSTTRAYWMLVRSGEVSVNQFICPSSGDVGDPTSKVDACYDFQEYTNISYGYLVPFGPVETRPRQGRDHRMIFAADKGPFYHEEYRPSFETAGPDGQEIDVSDPPLYWRPFNSPNHGGLGNGEGQNALFADGRVEFHAIPAIGLDQDNIYTVMIDDWFILPYNRTHGESPHASASPNPYPGQDAFGPGAGRNATTDSLIYP